MFLIGCSEGNIYSAEIIDVSEGTYMGQVRHVITVNITNNHYTSSVIKYQLKLVTPDAEYGCRSSWENVPYEENPEDWYSVQVNSKSSRTIQCHLLLDPGTDFEVSSPQVFVDKKWWGFW
tara:strand:- start:301 stop:660 length:360 start_codon:yes stop_codon:yes gene_type:complete